MKRKRMLHFTGLLVLVLMLVSPMAALAAGGTDPDDALTPSGEWQALNPGESHWYGFYYEGDGSQIQILLEAYPPGSAGFTLWTPEEMRRWRAGSEVEPIGRGSTNPASGEKLAWSGSFNDRGIYYVLAEHSDNQPGISNYSLSVSGDGVRLQTSLPASKPSATPAQAMDQTAPKPPSDPAGRLVFQTAVGGELYTVNVDGSNLQRVGDGMDPSWSPDGRQIASIRWTEPRGVWVMDADGGNARRVFAESEPRWTSWSPDGDGILFSRVTGGRLEAVEFCFRGFCFTFPAHPRWTMGIVNPVDGSFREPPPPDSRTSRGPNWSPVADQVVFADVQGLRIQTLDRSVSYMLTDDARDASPVWSPDGSKVAFVRRQHDHDEIYVVNTDGSNLRRLTSTPAKPDGTVGNSVSPAWSPDGQYIAFLTDRTGAWEIWLMNANGKNPGPMFDTALNEVTLDYGWVGELAIDWTD
jgi:TolB protein